MRAKYKENSRTLLYRPVIPVIHYVRKLTLRARLVNLSLDHEGRLYGYNTKRKRKTGKQHI